MNTRLQAATTKTLNELFLIETKKFILALEYGSSASDLEEMREHIREIEDLIIRKENEERRALSAVHSSNRTN
jgi:hypothetical protein